MSYCSVRLCDTLGSEQPIQSFDFPDNLSQRRKWMHFLRTTNGKIDKSLPLKICEKHFKPSEVLKGFSVTLIVPGSVPTIAVIKMNDIEEIGTKPGVTIQPKLSEPPPKQVQVERKKRDKIVKQKPEKQKRKREKAPSKPKKPRIVEKKKSKTISQVCKETGMCGSCLLVTGTPMSKIYPAAAAAFKEITEFETLSDYICEKCSTALRNYIVFKSQVKEKHKQIRENLTINLEDKQVDDEESESNEEDSLVESSDQQPFHKIQIQVADEDYDFMAQILNQNQLEQVKITENAPATSEEASCSSNFKIAKVDSWAPNETGSLKSEEPVVKKKRKKMITQKRTVEIPTSIENDPLGDDFMSNSEFIMNYAQNYKQLDEIVEDHPVHLENPKKIKQEQLDDDALPFFCDLCGHSSSDRDTIMDHIKKVHPGSSNGSGKLSIEKTRFSSSAD